MVKILGHGDSWEREEVRSGQLSEVNGRYHWSYIICII